MGLNRGEMREQFGRWSQMKKWQGSLDYPYRWAGVQADLLMLAGEMVDEMSSGSIVNPGDKTRKLAEIRGAWEQLQKAPILKRYDTFQIADAGCHLAFDLALSLFGVLGIPPKSLEELHICEECGWEATSARALAIHREKHALRVVEVAPEVRPERVVVDDRRAERVKELESEMPVLEKALAEAYGAWQTHLETEGRFSDRDGTGGALHKAYDVARHRLRKAKEKLRGLKEG